MQVVCLHKRGAIKAILSPIDSITNKFGVPEAVIPLMILRPLSGSASTAMVLDIFTKFGPDSIQGIISSLIISSSETTFYVLAILFGSVGIKEHKKVTIAAIVADIVAVVLAVMWANAVSI